MPVPSAFDDRANIRKFRDPSQFLTNLVTGGNKHRRIAGTARSNLRTDLLARDLACGIALTAVVAYLDVAKPFNRDWSIFYLLPVMYVAWVLPGRLALVSFCALTAVVFLVPVISAPNQFRTGTGGLRTF